MSSSDSEDDYYGNIAQKLQTLKNKCVQEKVTFDDTLEEITNNKECDQDANTFKIATEDFNTSLNSTDNDILTLDDIIAANPTPKRGRKRKTAPPIPTTRNTRRKTANSNKNTDDTVDISEVNAEESRSGAGKRGRRGRLKSAGSAVTTTSPRGSQRGRSRGTTPRGRARGRQRDTIGDWFMSNLGRNTVSAPALTNMYPIYSVGNTDDYPDLCDNQKLFSTDTMKANDVVTIDEEDPLATDNEELSVKVYWQSLEVVRFKIRKYQMLMPIFKYFSEKENVGFEKLLFTYNERILKAEDTPDSIDYSIAKFIDGGIVEQDVSRLTKQNSKDLKDGLKLKFQCQHLKKPFETIVKSEDKLALAMMKCAEHLEMSLDKLKFYFDGDLISSNNTARELDLEGGECIDVKIIS